MLQQLLLHRHQQRAPVSGRPPNAQASPRSPSALEKRRKGSAPEVVTTDFGRTLCVSATASSAFRPVLTGRAGDWSPSRRTQCEPRLPYFEVRDVSGDPGRRFFRPIADTVVTTSGGKPPTSTNDKANQPAIPDTVAGVNQDSTAARVLDTTTTTTERIHAASSKTVEPPTRKSHKLSSQCRSPGMKLQRAHRSRTAELRLYRTPTSAATESVPTQRQAPDSRQDLDQRSWGDDDDDDAVFGSEAGSVALSSVSARSRTKSDSSVIHAASSKLAPVAAAGSSSSFPVDMRQDPPEGRRRSAGWAVDSCPHHSDSSAANGPQSLRTSPFGQSPSPLIVRKLKSAAELLRECNELHQQRRSRPASSASSVRPFVAITGPEISYYVTATLVTPPTSAASAVTPRAAKPDLEGSHTSTENTDSSVLRTFETATSSTSEPRACTSSSVDNQPTLAQSPLLSTELSEKSGLRTETTTSIEPATTTTITGDVHRTSEIPGSVVTSSTEMAGGSRSNFLDSNWFLLPKMFKTSK